MYHHPPDACHRRVTIRGGEIEGRSAFRPYRYRGPPPVPTGTAALHRHRGPPRALCRPGRGKAEAFRWDFLKPSRRSGRGEPRRARAVDSAIFTSKNGPPVHRTHPRRERRHAEASRPMRQRRVPARGREAGLAVSSAGRRPAPLRSEEGEGEGRLDDRPRETASFWDASQWGTPTPRAPRRPDRGREAGSDRRPGMRGPRGFSRAERAEVRAGRGLGPLAGGLARGERRRKNGTVQVFRPSRSSPPGVRPRGSETVGSREPRLGTSLLRSVCYRSHPATWAPHPQGG